MAINLLSYTKNMQEGYFASTNTNVLYIDGYSGYITGAGNVNINWTGYSGIYYNTGSTTFNISKKTLIATPDNKTKMSGNLNPEFTISISGFVYGQNNSNLNISPTGYTTALINSPTGVYYIISSGGSGINYNFDHRTGYLTIIPNPDSIIVNNDIDWEIIYG